MEISKMSDISDRPDSLKAATDRVVRATGVLARETPSDRIVRSLKAANPNIRQHGFRKALAAVGPIAHLADLARFVPDAFHISTDRQVVTIIEVDDTNPIDSAKAEKIGALADALAGEGWDTVVMVLDYGAGIKAVVPGWAFMEAYTSRCAGAKQEDYTPAAAAAYREFLSQRSTPLDMSALADRLDGPDRY